MFGICRNAPPPKETVDEDAFSSSPQVSAAADHTYSHVCPVGHCTEHLLDVSTTLTSLQERVTELETELDALRIAGRRKKPMAIADIKDDPEKVIMGNEYSRPNKCNSFSSF